MMRRKLVSRPPLRSHEIALNYSGWGSDALKQRFFDNLVIKVGRLPDVSSGIYVYICYGDTPMDEDYFTDVPFFEKADDGNLVVTRFRAKSEPIKKGLPPQNGIPIRTHLSREIYNFIPKKKIDRLISILHREWGSNVPVKNNTRYAAIMYQEREGREESNRIIFSSLLRSTGLSLNTASKLFSVREDSLRKILDGKTKTSDYLVEQCQKLEREIQRYADIISEKVRNTDGDEVNITIYETERGHDIAVAYNIDAYCYLNINGEDNFFSYNSKEGVWSIPAFQAILGRVIGKTNKKLNIKEIPWTL